jgi:hypothetical protein
MNAKSAEHMALYALAAGSGSQTAPFACFKSAIVAEMKMTDG